MLPDPNRFYVSAGANTKARVSVRYLGSKASTLPTLQRLLSERATPPGTFCDPFGGVAVVGSHFRTHGWTVHSGDILRCAYHFQISRLAIQSPPLPHAVCDELGVATPLEFSRYLETLPPVRSWLHREFSQRRDYLTERNAVQIDAARRELVRLCRLGALSGSAAAYYNACLIASMDRVANTAGTYYAHLKGWHRKALNPFRFLLVEPASGPIGSVYFGQASALVQRQHWDVLYLDPPHNGRDYAAYYHLPETLATGRRPRPHGKSGVDRAPRPKSEFLSRHTAPSALRSLLYNSSFTTLVLHYTDTGLIDRRELQRILSPYGQVEPFDISATGYSNRGDRATRHHILMVTTQ